MPKATRPRSALHSKAVRLRRQQVDVDTDSGESETPLEHSTSIASAITSLNAEASGVQMAEQPVPETMKKKEKQLLKHDKFLQRLEASRSPYSKSHDRRIRRRAKEQVGNGLDDIKAAISIVEMGESFASADAMTPGNAPLKPKPRLEPGQIGEGKHTTLSKSQRKQALKAERLRIPRILSNSEFSSNPFETIRKHAQNTLIKHEVPK